MNWNIPALIIGFFVAIGLVLVSALMGATLPGYYAAIGPVLLWTGIGFFYLGMKRARKRRR